jgi:MoxR-like ATPase
LRLVRATRVNTPEAAPFINEWCSWGAGPRGVQNLLIGGKAVAALDGRYFVTTEDVKAVAHPVLRHRVITNFNAESEGITTDRIIDRLLETVTPQDAANAGVTAKALK